MGGWAEVADLADLRRRKRLQVTAGEARIALFYVDGVVYALDDVCVHKQRALSKGTVLHGRVICPGHQWRIDPATGEVEGREERQPTHAVRVEGGKVYVGSADRAGSVKEVR